MSLSKWGYLFSVVVCLAWSLVLPPAVAAGDIESSLDTPPLKIDFNDVVENKTSHLSENGHLELKIAVAAMISPKYTYKYYVDLLNLIGDLTDRTVRFIQKKTYAEINDMIGRNEIDLAFVCSGPYVSGKKKFGMQILAVPLCHGEKEYYSYFITSKAGNIRSFDELRGRTFAFTDPLSNSGYVVPTYILALRGETPETFFKKTFFTHSHDNSIQAVADGLADGAAIDSLIYNFIQAKSPEITKKTIIVDKSPPYGIPPIVVSPKIDAGLKKKLKNIFLSIHKYPQAKTILDNLQIDRFIEGNDDDYDTVREMQNFINTNYDAEEKIP